MKLSGHDLALIAGHHARQLRRRLRIEFAGDGDDAEARGHYFDVNIAVAESLPASIPEDHLVLLELGWLQRCAVKDSPQFRECQARGKWYGRRMWLQDQLERLTGTDTG